LDTYLDALKDFPDFETKLVTEKGDAICQKQDIFKGLMWFAYTNNFANWHVLKIDQVKEIVAQNKQKIKVSALEDFAIELVVEQEANFNNAMGQESLTRFDQPKKKNNNKNRNKVATQNPQDRKRTDEVSQTNPNQIKANPNQNKINPNQNKINPNQNKNANPNQQKANPNQNPNQSKPANKKPIIIKKNEDSK
jgi:hypothetical protein